MNSKFSLLQISAAVATTLAIQACADRPPTTAQIMQDQYSTRVCGLLKESPEKDVYSIEDKESGNARNFKASGGQALAKANSALNQEVCVDFWTSGSDPFFSPVTDPAAIRLISSLRTFEKCGVLVGPTADAYSYALKEITGRPNEVAGIHVEGLTAEFIYLIEANKRFCINAAWSPASMTEYTEIFNLSALRHEDGSALPHFDYGTLKATSDTFLKTRTGQASSLSDHEKCLVPKNSFVNYAIKRNSADSEHFEILLKSVVAADRESELCSDFVAGATSETTLLIFKSHVK